MIGHWGVVRLPAALRFLAGQFHDAAAAAIHVQRIAFDVNPRPHDFAWLRNATQRAAAAGKIHGWLAESFGAGPTARKMRRRSGAADEEHPHVFAHRAGLIPVAPANVVQRGFHRLPRGPLHAIREQRIQPRAFIHFIEVHQRLAFEQNSPAVSASNGRTVGIVKRPFDQVACRQQILQPLLILNAD